MILTQMQIGSSTTGDMSDLNWEVPSGRHHRKRGFNDILRGNDWPWLPASSLTACSRMSETASPRDPRTELAESASRGLLRRTLVRYGAISSPRSHCADHDSNLTRNYPVVQKAGTAKTDSPMRSIGLLTVLTSRPSPLAGRSKKY
jgi:hypothetical protein